MRDALGAAASILVLGGTSDIAVATVERLAADRCRRAVLAVRDPDGAAAQVAVARCRAAGVEEVALVAFDASDVDGHAGTIDAAVEAIGDLDLVLIAFGVLGDQATYDADPALAAADTTANVTGTVSIGLHAAARLRAQGHGTLIVLSSVAAERPRKTNYVYAASKTAVDAFSQGLGDALVGTGARLMVVRPGFVHSKMTEGLDPQPFATTPEKVADGIAEGLRRGREIIWVPGLLRWLFVVMRHLPRPVWRIVSNR